MRLIKYSKNLIKVLTLLSVMLGAFYWTGLYRWVDIYVFKERGKDFTGEYLFHEDWTNISLIKTEYDYSWLSSSADPILIAHALGASGLHSQNSLTEMKKSLSQGLKLMEVDLWLDSNTVIRCHHGPDIPGPLRSDDCTFEKALELASENKVWLVLDIKTDFETTSKEILKKTSRTELSRIIFQLYKPHHVELFERWSREQPLPGPIITLYLARRSVSHVQRHMRGSGFKVLAVPSQRLAALNLNLSDRVKIFSHPTHRCEDFLDQRVRGATGFYITSDMMAKVQERCLK